MRHHLSRNALLIVILALVCGTLAVLDASARARLESRPTSVPLVIPADAGSL